MQNVGQFPFESSVSESLKLDLGRNDNFLLSSTIVNFHLNFQSRNLTTKCRVRFSRRNLHLRRCYSNNRNFQFSDWSDSRICPWTLYSTFRPAPWRSKNTESLFRCRRSAKKTFLVKAIFTIAVMGCLKKNRKRSKSGWIESR